jgi:cell division protein FtsN
MYRNQALAEQLQAKLTRLGIRSEVQSIILDREAQHRVRASAISDLEELNRVRAMIHRAGVKAEAIRVGE